MIPQPIRRRLDTPESARVAVIGASRDPQKFGQIILRDLRTKGFDVIPVNPNVDVVASLRAYPAVGAIEGPVAIANFVVPPNVGRQVLQDLDPEQVGAVWFQPGSHDPDLVRAARRRWEAVIVDACIMVETAAEGRPGRGRLTGN